QRFLFGRTAFTLEETAGNAAGGVELFLVVDGEREEILSFACFLRGDRRDHHHGATHADHHRAGCLARNLAGFYGDGVIAVLERLGYFCHGSCPLVCAFAFGKRRKPASVRMRRLPAKGSMRARRSATQAETADQRLIALGVLALEITEQATASVDHLQETTTRMMVFLVRLEMLGQLLDARGQQRNLHLRRTGVGRRAAVILDDLAGLFGGKRHGSLLDEWRCWRAGSGTWLVQRHRDAVAQAAAGMERSRILGFGEPNSLTATSGWLQGPRVRGRLGWPIPIRSISQQKRPGEPGRSNQQPCGCRITWRWKPELRTWPSSRDDATSWRDASWRDARTSWPEPRQPVLRQQPEQRPARSWPEWSGRQTPESRTRPQRWRRGSTYALQWSPGNARVTMTRRRAYSA